MVPVVPHSYRRLMDGMTVDIGGRSWRCIAGYGHAPEHISLHCEALGVLISGDMMLPRISTNVSVWEFEPESDPLRLFLASIDRFAPLAADTLTLPSHGKPFTGLHARIRQLHDHHRDRLAEVMKVVADLGALLAVHAEDPDALDQAPAPHGRRYCDFLASRPPWAENTAINRVLGLARRFDARVHISHLSSAELPHIVRYFVDRGVRASVETCPHYLTFCAEEIPDGATEFKCRPPIRDAENRERLWRALVDGVIGSVASAHSPCTADLKRYESGDFAVARDGISGIELSLPAVWTGARRRGIELSTVVRWMAGRPADLVGLRQKGRIAPGADADFCVFAPDAAFVVDVARLHHRNPISPYHDRPLAGVVRGTWLRGIRVTGDRAHGELLTRAGADAGKGGDARKVEQEITPASTREATP